MFTKNIAVTSKCLYLSVKKKVEYKIHNVIHKPTYLYLFYLYQG